MKNLILLLFTLCLCYSSHALITTKTISVHFQSGAYHITKEHKLILDEFISELSLEGDFELIITGHTDSDGSASSNLILSKKRADELGKYLGEIGFTKQHMLLDYKGEYEAQAQDPIKEVKERNRRVDILFKSYNFEHIDEVMAELKPMNKSHFSINPKEKNLIQGKSGTTIQISPFSFVDQSGNPFTGEVDIVLTEALGMSDFLEEELSTIAQDKMLISGGMYKLEAFDGNGNSLTLREDKFMDVVVPSRRIEEGMEVFISQDGADWNNTNDPVLTLNNTIDYSDKPNFKGIKWIKPKYHPDLASKPRKPSEPMYPKRPKAPNPAAFHVDEAWYNFYGKKQRRKQAARRYKDAIARYEEKLLAYEIRCKDFQKECNEYAENLNRYFDELSHWENLEKERKALFNSEILAEEYKDWNESNYSCLKDYEKKLAKWRHKKDSLYNLRFAKMDEMGVAPKKRDQSYLLKQANLGWINIDRFYMNTNTDALVVRTNRSDDEKIILHFEDINSCMHLIKKGDKAIHKAFPLNEKARIFAYKVENGQLLLCEKEVTGITEVKLKYLPIKFSDFRKRLTSLGKA